MKLRSFNLISTRCFNRKSSPNSMSSWIGAKCTTSGNVVLSNFNDTGPTIRPSIFISHPAVCNVTTFRHGGFGFISLYTLSESIVTIAAVSTTAFKAFPWSITGILDADDEESWQMVMSPKLLFRLHVFSSAGSQAGYGVTP